MSIQFQIFIGKVWFSLHQVIMFVNDECTNITTIATPLHSIINCKPLKIFKVYEYTFFFLHMMESKAYQYATNDNKVPTQLKKNKISFRFTTKRLIKAQMWVHVEAITCLLEYCCSNVCVELAEGVVVGVKNLCYNWTTLFIELCFNSLTSYFVWDFVSYCYCSKKLGTIVKKI